MLAFQNYFAKQGHPQLDLQQFNSSKAILKAILKDTYNDSLMGLLGDEGGNLTTDRTNDSAMRPMRRGFGPRDPHEEEELPLQPP